MTDLFSIEAAFEQAFNENKPVVREDPKPARDTFPYSTFDICRNTGIILIKLVPDEKGRPYKGLNGCLLGKIPFNNDKGEVNYKTLRWCRNENYNCQLTDAQVKLNNELHDKIELCNKLREDSNSYPLFKYSSKVTILFSYIRKITHTERTSSAKIQGDPSEYSNPKITTLFCRSSSFVTGINDAINTRKQNYDNDTSWMREYFNRNVGNSFRFLSVTTLRPNIGYTINFDFIELPNKKISVTEDDLNEARNLDEAFINTNFYDEEFYSDSLNKLDQYNKELSGLGHIESYEPDRTNNN